MKNTLPAQHFMRTFCVLNYMNGCKAMRTFLDCYAIGWSTLTPTEHTHTCTREKHNVFSL